MKRMTSLDSRRDRPEIAISIAFLGNRCWKQGPWVDLGPCSKCFLDRIRSPRTSQFASTEPARIQYKRIEIRFELLKGPIVLPFWCLTQRVCWPGSTQWDVENVKLVPGRWLCWTSLPSVSAHKWTLLSPLPSMGLLPNALRIVR